jgi:hypothetical protein
VLRNFYSGFHFAVPEFRILMDVPAPFNHPALDVAGHIVNTGLQSGINLCAGVYSKV